MKVLQYHTQVKIPLCSSVSMNLSSVDTERNFKFKLTGQIKQRRQKALKTPEAKYSLLTYCVGGGDL